jgi:probable rRNA maturation factor
VDPDSSRARIAVTDGRGRAVRDRGLARWLAGVAPAHARGDIAIALVTDQHIRKLNCAYRGKDVATDVLSFPATDFRLKAKATLSRKRVASGFSRKDAPDAESPLGDIVIATGVAKRQAREARHPYATELRVLALHGLLHLLGYDHEDPHDDGRMARAEARLRRKGGLRDGLISRRRSLDRAELRRGTLDGPARRRQRLRPARAAGGQRGAAAPARVRERGWGPASRKK